MRNFNFYKFDKKANMLEFKNNCQNHSSQLIEFFEVTCHVSIVLNALHRVDLQYVLKLSKGWGDAFLHVTHNKVPTNEQGNETKSEDSPIDILNIIDIRRVITDQETLELRHEVPHEVEEAPWEVDVQEEDVQAVL